MEPGHWRVGDAGEDVRGPCLRVAANARGGNKAAPISPPAPEAVERIDAVFDAERAIDGLTADARSLKLGVHSAPGVARE